MDAFTSLWNQLMSMAVFAGLIASVFLIATLYSPKSSMRTTIIGFMHKHILVIGFLISFAALVSSLVYSNVIGYEPCMLCWYARIAFYPQVLLFGMAVIKRERVVLNYALMLSAFGLLVTSYHSYIQWAGEALLPCSATGVSCVTRYVYEYGFITLPFMGFVGFLTLFLSILVSKKAVK